MNSKQRQQYEEMWKSAVVSKGPSTAAAVKLINANKATYQAAAGFFKMPFEVVGAIHYRESNGNFKTHLANGDSLKADTKRVPKNIMRPLPPPYEWHEAAIAALEHHMDGWNINYHKYKWDIPGTLDFIQKWHGYGVILNHPGQHDAYLWNGTQYYTKGSYESDGVWKPDLVDKNAGCVAILKALNFICP